MKKKQRGIRIAIAVVVIIAAVLFFCACNDLTMDEAFPTLQDGSETTVASPAASQSSDEAKKSESAAEPQKSETTDTTATSDGSEQELAQTEETQDATQVGTVDDGSSVSSQNGEGGASSNGGGDQEGEEGGSSDEGQDGDNEDTTEVIDEFTRITSVAEPSEWTIFAYGREIARGSVTIDACLTTDAFTEPSVELWRKGQEVFLYFESLGGYRKAVFRSELLAVQIELSDDDLAILLASPSLDEETDTQGSTPEDGVPQGGGGQESGDLEQDDFVGESEEREEGSESGENSEDDLGEQGTEPEEGNEEENESGGSIGEGTPDSGSVICPLCGANLSESAAHIESCANYAVIPLESEAHDFLEALPGVREKLNVTVVDAETEIYDLVLNYLTTEDLTEIENALRASDKVINFAVLANGNREYRVLNKIGEKQFTVYALAESVTEHYKVTLHVSGAIPDPEE